MTPCGSWSGGCETDEQNDRNGGRPDSPVRRGGLCGVHAGGGALGVSYGSSMFIAFGIVLMMSAFAVAVPPDRRAVGPADDPRGVFRQLPGDACAGGVPGGWPRMGGRGSAGVLVRLLLPHLRAVSSPLPAE